MDPNLKTKWVAALRSGEYEQGRSYLNRDGKYCCLGVLCELAVQEGVATSIPTQGLPNVIRYGTEDSGYGFSSSYLPQNVAVWADVDENGHLPLTDEGTEVKIYRGTGTPDQTTSSLAVLNDDGFTFEQIAAIIEEHF